MQATSEIGKSIRAGGALTNYHEAGQGTPVILIHGSGPGVSAWANWSRTIPSLAEHFHVFAYDQLGFGYTELPRENRYGLEQWTEHLLDFMRAVGVAQAHLIGNSMGAAVALAVAVKHPEVVDRLVLMGAAGVTRPALPTCEDYWISSPITASSSPTSWLSCATRRVSGPGCRRHSPACSQHRASREWMTWPLTRIVSVKYMRRPSSYTGGTTA